MKKMNAITFANTGHVLGVVTRNSQPETVATAAQLATGGFRLRSVDSGSSESLTLDIQEQDVGVAQVDYDTRILYRPHLFVVDGGGVEQKMIPAAATVSLTGTQITVTLPGMVSNTVEVWCHIWGDELNEPIVRSILFAGTVAAPVNVATEDLFLARGDYVIGLFVPGYALGIFLESV